MRAYAYHCLSAAARIRQLLRAAGALLPLRETLRLPALTLVHKLGATSELERLLSCSDRPFFCVEARPHADGDASTDSRSGQGCRMAFC
jgi:hypothetical protein